MFSSSFWAGFGFNDHQIPLKKMITLKTILKYFEDSNHQLVTSIFFWPTINLAFPFAWSGLNP